MKVATKEMDYFLLYYLQHYPVHFLSFTLSPPIPIKEVNYTDS